MSSYFDKVKPKTGKLKVKPETQEILRIKNNRIKEYRIRQRAKIKIVLLGRFCVISMNYFEQEPVKVSQIPNNQIADESVSRIRTQVKRVD